MKGHVDTERDERNGAAHGPHQAGHEVEQRHRELVPNEQIIGLGQLQVVGGGVLVGKAESVGRDDTQHQQLERRGAARRHRGRHLEKRECADRGGG